MRVALPALLPIALLIAPARAGSGGPAALLGQHAGFLLSRAVGERRPGSPGLHAAAAYAASELERSGLRPGGRNGTFLMPVRIPVVRSGALTEVAFGKATVTAGCRTLPVSEIPPSGGCIRSGAFVFCGYGLSGSDSAWNDFAGQDVAGRVVLVVAGGAPNGETPRAPADVAAAAAKRGAAAVLVVDDPRAGSLDEVTLANGKVLRGHVLDRGSEFLFTSEAGGPPERLTKADIREIRLRIPAGPPGRSGPSPVPDRSFGVPVVGVSAAVADRLLGRSLRSVLDSMDVAGHPGSFGRPELTVRVRADLRKETLEVPRVAAVLNGTEEGPRTDPVVVAAALDGEREGGAAVLLAVADLLGRRDRPRRPVLFVLFTAGERGSLGVTEMKGLPVRPGRGGGLVTIESRRKSPVLLVRPARSVKRLQKVGRRIGISTGVVGATFPSRFTGLSQMLKGPWDGLLVPALPGGGRAGNLGAGMDAVRLVVRRVLDLANAPGKKAAAKKGIPPVPRSPPVRATLDAARAARRSGDLEAARREIEAVLDRDPGNPDLYLERGRIRWMSGDMQGALEDADDIGKLVAGDGRAWVLRSEVFGAEGEPRMALNCLTRAAESGLVSAMLSLGLRLIDAGLDTREEGIGRLRSVAATAPGTAAGSCARGALALYGGDRAGAQRWLGLALKKDPMLADAYFCRGMLSVLFNADAALGERNFDRAMRLGADPGSTRFHRGQVRVRLKEYSLAIEDFEACRERKHAVALCDYRIASVHAVIGDRKEALDWLGRAFVAGFERRDEVRNDPAFEGLRSDPRFQAILRSRHTQ